MGAHLLYISPDTPMWPEPGANGLSEMLQAIPSQLVATISDSTVMRGYQFLRIISSSLVA